jgi:hypothetical protein
MSLEFAKTAPGVMVASWTHPKSGRVQSVAIIKSCDAWNTFIDGEWIARDLSSFEDAVAAAERKLTPRASSNMIRVAGVCLLAVILGASAVVISKFMPVIPAVRDAAVREGEGANARASKNTEKVETVAPDKSLRDLAISQQPLPVRRDRPALQPRADHF